MALIVRPVTWAEEIGERIRSARTELGLSRAALGDLVEAHEKSIGNYERGDHVPWERLPRIAAALNVDLRWLLHGQAYEDPLVDVQSKLERLLGLMLEGEMEQELDTTDATGQQPASDTGEAGGERQT